MGKKAHSSVNSASHATDMPFHKLIPPFTLTGWGGGVVQNIKKSVKNLDLRHKVTAKKNIIIINNRLLQIFIFIYFYYFFIFENLFPHLYFIIRILSFAFSHPHFIILILSSAFCYPHFVIGILLSAIRCPPSAAIRSAFYRDPGNVLKLSLTAKA